MVSFRKGVSPEIQAAVENVLLSMHTDPAGREALQAASNIGQIERLTAEDKERLAEWREILALVEDP